MHRLKQQIRDIPDFPEPGIVFKDITPLVKNPDTLRLSVHQLIHPFIGQGIDLVAGMEARGFIFGTLAAWELGVGFIPLRKPGKLPYHKKSISYDLEYGSATLEAHSDAIGDGQRVLVIDDVLATGGTAAASCQLIEQLGGQISGCAFVIELNALNGREKLNSYQVHSLLNYD
ncbi:MAG: adenine phosphoribosyltransferase [Gammaproteobacteria bacterium]|nr:adenine phosphoribosyltransferase [Gammaproteobacteria bacterium]